MIIIKRDKYLDAQDALPAPVGVEGWFTLAAKKGHIVARELQFRARSVGPFHNLITDNGLDGFGFKEHNALYRYAHVGTGTAPPNAADVGLSNFLDNLASGTTVTNGFSPAPDFEYTYIRMRWTTAVGQLGNSILTECGVSGQTSNGDLFSRELIRDATGEPVGFPILPDEQLELTYELRLYRPMSDVEAQIQIGSQTYDTVTRVIRAGNANYWKLGSPMTTGNNVLASGSGNGAFSGGLVAENGWEPSGTMGVPSTANVGYTSGNLYRDATYTWGPAVGNGNIRTIVHNRNCCSFQTEYDPPIAKNNTQTLILPQRFSWGRQ